MKHFIHIKRLKWRKVNTNRFPIGLFKTTGMPFRADGSHSSMMMASPAHSAAACLTTSSRCFVTSSTRTCETSFSSSYWKSSGLIHSPAISAAVKASAPAPTTPGLRMLEYFQRWRDHVMRLLAIEILKNIRELI